MSPLREVTEYLDEASLTWDARGEVGAVIGRAVESTMSALGTAGSATHFGSACNASSISFAASVLDAPSAVAVQKAVLTGNTASSSRMYPPVHKARCFIPW